MKRRWVRWAAPLALVLVAAAVAVPLTVHGSSGPPHGQTWIATLATIRALHDQDADVATQFFDQPSSFALGGYGHAAYAVSWASEAQFELDLAAGAIPGGVAAVMYDPERWAHTPDAEQRDPVAAIEAFASAARTAGYEVIVTPHPNLVGVPGATCGAGPEESIEDAFLRCGITGSAARVADVVEVQAQYLETDPARYADVVGRAAAQARAANPKVRLVAGLSTRFATDPGVLVAAWTAARDIVDGHYMAVPEGIRPEVAAAFLAQIGASGT